MSLALIRAGRYPCVYCGETTDTVDHVPPVLLKNEVPEKDRFCVPACTECNCTLGCKRLFTVLDRQIYLRLKYREKYARYLSLPDRTNSDIDEFGYTLKTAVETGYAIKESILARLSFNNNNLKDIRLKYYPCARSSKDRSSFLEAARGLPEAVLSTFEDELAELIKHDPWINGVSV